MNAVVLSTSLAISFASEYYASSKYKLTGKISKYKIYCSLVSYVIKCINFMIFMCYPLTIFAKNPSFASWFEYFRIFIIDPKVIPTIGSLIVSYWIVKPIKNKWITNIIKPIILITIIITCGTTFLYLPIYLLLIISMIPGILLWLPFFVIICTFCYRIYYFIFDENDNPYIVKSVLCLIGTFISSSIIMYITYLMVIVYSSNKYNLSMFGYSFNLYVVYNIHITDITLDLVGIPKINGFILFILVIFDIIRFVICMAINIFEEEIDADIEMDDLVNL